MTEAIYLDLDTGIFTADAPYTVTYVSSNGRLVTIAVDPTKDEAR